MPSEYQIRQEMAQRQQQEMDALTLRLESAEQDRAYLLAENQRLLASLFEEQRQMREISETLGIDRGATYDQAISRIVVLRADAFLPSKDAPSCPPAAEVAPEAPAKKKRAMKAREAGQ